MYKEENTLFNILKMNSSFQISLKYNELYKYKLSVPYIICKDIRLNHGADCYYLLLANRVWGIISPGH